MCNVYNCVCNYYIVNIMLLLLGVYWEIILTFVSCQVLSLPYLDMVVHETMRLFPVLPVIDREAMQPYKIPNFDLVIEKHTPIFISLLGLHYDPEYFPNPEKFDPERFNEENRNNIPSCVYMPFGEGPRKCIGKNIIFQYSF